MRGSALQGGAGASMPRRRSKPSVSALSKSILRATWEFDPTRAANLGLHRYDGRLPVYTKATIERRVGRIRRDLTSLDALARRDGLSTQAKLEVGVLRSLLLKEQFALVDQQSPRRAPRYMLGKLSIVDYLLRNYAPLDRRVRAIAKLQAQVPAHLDRFRALVDRSLAETQYEMAEMNASGMIEAYGQELPAFFPQLSPATRRLVERTNAVAVAELTRLKEELRSRYKPRVRKEFALGKAKYERMLWAEHLAKLPVDRLLEVGTADLEANKQAFLETAAAVAPGKAPKDAVAVIADHHPTADSLIPDTQTMLEDIRTFLIDHDVVAVPSEDRPTVMETPKFYRWASAATNAPGSFEKVAKETFYYVTPVEPEWPPEKQEEWLRYLNYTSLRNISVHEMYPGHFVHHLHSRYRVRSPVLKSFWSTAFGEGWAHYSEEMMIGVGFQEGDPKYRMAQLMDALLRDCRYISSIRMHVYGWSWEDATRFFMENAFMDRLPAEREAKRGTFDPGYLNYTLGKLMIKKLRADWMAAHPEASLREFHDAFLALGAPPLGLAREALLGPGAGPAL